MPAMSFSDQPSVRPHPVDHHPDRCAGGHARAARPARGPAGPAPPGRRADHDHLVGRARAPPGSARCARAGAEVGAGSSSRLKPVSTTTCPCARATSSRCSTGAGAHLDPAVGARQPGDHRRGGRRRRAAPTRTARRAAAAPPAGPREQAGHLVEDAELLGDRAAVGVDVDQDACGARAGPAPAARLVATVVRPGRRPGPRPRRPGPAAGAARRRLGGSGSASRTTRVGGRPRRRPRRRAASSSSSSATTARMPIRVARSRPRRGRRRRRARRDRAHARARRRWSTAAGSRPGASRATHGDVGLAGGGGREQVVDVDAALEDHDAGVLVEQAERRRLPGRARGQRPGRRPRAQPRRRRQDRGRRPRPTQPEEALGVVLAGPPSTSCRLPLTAKESASGGASRTVTSSRTSSRGRRPAARRPRRPGPRRRPPSPDRRRRAPARRRPRSAAGTVSLSVGRAERGRAAPARRADAAVELEVGGQLARRRRGSASRSAASANRTRRGDQVVGGHASPGAQVGGDRPHRDRVVGRAEQPGAGDDRDRRRSRPRSTAAGRASPGSWRGAAAGTSVQVPEIPLTRHIMSPSRRSVTCSPQARVARRTAATVRSGDDGAMAGTPAS